MLSIAFNITPSDTDVVPAHEAIYIGGDGDLTVTTRIPDGFGGFTETDVTLKGLVAGRLLPISVYKVKAATTATELVGWR